MSVVNHNIYTSRNGGSFVPFKKGTLLLIRGREGKRTPARSSGMCTACCVMSKKEQIARNAPKDQMMACLGLPCDRISEPE